MLQLTVVRVDSRASLPVLTAEAKFKEARFLNDLLEDDLWEHFHVEARGDDHVSIHHAGS